MNSSTMITDYLTYLIRQWCEKPERIKFTDEMRQIERNFPSEHIQNLCYVIV